MLELYKNKQMESNMLSKLNMRLNVEGQDKLNYNMSSVMQGILMEKLPIEYVEKMHIDGLHPYQQFLQINGEEYCWNIHTTTKEAKNNIIQKIMCEDNFYIEKKDIRLKVIQRNFSEMTYDQLLEQFYFNNGSRYLTLHFETATSFKSGGGYIFYPSIRHIFQSIINKHNEFNKETEISGENLLEELEHHIEIIQYNLRSIFFYMEHVKIPAFIGNIRIKISGSQPIVNLVNFLLAYSEFSGIGIKCGMGMGACRVEWKHYSEVKR